MQWNRLMLLFSVRSRLKKRKCSPTDPVKSFDKHHHNLDSYYHQYFPIAVTSIPLSLLNFDIDSLQLLFWISLAMENTTGITSSAEISTFPLRFYKLFFFVLMCLIIWFCRVLPFFSLKYSFGDFYLLYYFSARVVCLAQHDI